MFTFSNDVESTVCGEGVTRKILSRGGKLMMVEVTAKKGSLGPIHGHPHEQTSYIVKGSFKFNLDGEEKLLEKGDSVYIPPNVDHGCIALEDDSVILDVFTPQREDFLK